jgi:UDP-N-acetylmuramyl pentapeptide synthase
MLELGDKEVEYHKQMGQYLKNIDILICIGDLSWNIANEAITLYPNLKQFQLHQWEEAIPILEKDLQKEDVILFKASHRIQLDCLCDKICSLIQ